MKKNEEVGFDITQNSTKLLSFEKNESKNQISLSQHKKKTNRINSPRHNIKRKSYYVIDVEKLFNGHEN